jgi:gluconate 2-dehydrogenase gamma chain
VAGQLAPSLVFFTPSEAAEIEAISSLIIPTDDTPGAREAGAVYFIDRALEAFLAPIAGVFRDGLADFGQRLDRAYPGTASIAGLSPSDANAFLGSVEHTQFFGLCRTFTVWGTLADPAHGGNRNHVGWRMIGFEDRHGWQPPFGYYDADAHEGGE